jgi:hypothetical protein
MWHFNDLVYNKQINLQVDEFKNENENENENSTLEYNQILSNSQFSLCPLGAGLNSIRLWESLAVGSIPVVLADGYELPLIHNADGQKINWNESLIHFPEKDIGNLDWHLRKMDATQKKAMSIAAKKAYEYSQLKSCFGKLIKEAESIKSSLDLKMCIYVPYYGEKDKYFWRRTHHGLYDLVMDWHQRGWINIAHHDGPYYWIGGVGQILLFDRDQVADLIDKKRGKPRWKGEVPYKYGFFCNEYNLENDRNFKFEYWSYKPIELEKRALSTTPKSYSERTIESIFLGSIENETQEYFRNKFSDWGECIDEYYVADKLNKKETNKYTFNEYLDKVSQAKFGVCFRGNGPKCYREIEYAAFGTPLILTEGVDTNYPAPLIEGIHYFFAKNKEDISRVIRDTEQIKWKLMSQAVRTWYEENFTSNNMFDKLNDLVKEIDLTLKKPESIFIESGIAEEFNLTKESFEIFNPGLNILEKYSNNTPCIRVKPGDIFINELPYLNGKSNYRYIVDNISVKELRYKTLESNLLKNNKLCILLKWRLRNFDLRLVYDGVEIDANQYINNNDSLNVKKTNINYEIKIKHNFMRLLSYKYLNREILGLSPIYFPNIVIKSAKIHFKIDNKLYEEDLTDRYSEYVASYDKLLEKKELFKAFKFWELENALITKFECSYIKDNQNLTQQFNFL